MKRHFLYFIVLCCCLSAVAQDQEQQGQGKNVKITGSIQSDMLVPMRDEAIGAEKTEDFQTNTYADLMLQSKYVDAGLRLEYLDHPLPGFEKDFKGWGLPHFWVKGRYKNTELTLGTFYEQFGLGLILRSYEERSLGIDNSLLGARLVTRPYKGITIKALSGRQRRYWSWNKGLVSGADAELNLNEWIPALQQHGTELMIGGSWVNKYEKQEDIFVDPTHKLNLPKYVNAWDVRATLNTGPWSFLAEYAQKTQDPSFDNGYSYEKGTVGVLSGSFSQKGLSILLQAKRSENMSFRSRRSMIGTSSFINHLPAFTQDQTYALAALYPYATQLADGEWAYQAEVGYNFKRKTKLGGKYGMNVKLNFSHVRWAGETFYQDIDLTVTRKLSKNVKLALMYMNQRYNQTVVEGHGGMIRSNIFIADAKFQLSSKTSLRTELQYLSTPDDLGDWLYGLAEFSLAPSWMFSVSDMYNVGETNIHYYHADVTFSASGHRVSLGFGRTRAGYNCSGGVCRYVPASRGFTLSYNYNFSIL
ncbi:MAG: hypothetical protein II691_08055 [Muribaculaceae bacterium]|nr:hypothetical protein [Muribaculaceae bacterium]MBQ6649265.1 hypothetical protein [Muribaculaceae bacterium]